MPESMTFCDDHWNRLRAKIDEAGLSHLVSANGEIAAMKETSAWRGDEPTLDNYDPLMHAHNSIMLNTIQMIGVFEGCPLCTLDTIHAEQCVGEDEGCQLPEEDAFAFFLDKATEDAVEVARGLE